MLERGTAVGFVASRENEAVGREDRETIVVFIPPMGIPVAALLAALLEAPLAKEEAPVVGAVVRAAPVDVPVVAANTGGAGGAWRASKCSCAAQAERRAGSTAAERIKEGTVRMETVQSEGNQLQEKNALLIWLTHMLFLAF